MELNENVEDAVKEETGSDIVPIGILGVYPDPSRDASGHRLSITFIARIISAEEKAAEAAESLEWLS